MGLDLEESAVERARAGARGVLASAAFNLGVGGAVVITAAAIGLVTYGDRPIQVALAAIAAGVAVYLLSSIAVFGFQLGAAPVRQRDELRRAVRGANQLSSDEIAGRVSDFARRGEDLMQGLKAAGGYTADQEDEIERWTSEAACFLSSHCGGEGAVEFSGASRGATRQVAKLEARIAVLDRLVEALGL